MFGTFGHHLRDFLVAGSPKGPHVRQRWFPGGHSGRKTHPKWPPRGHFGSHLEAKWHQKVLKVAPGEVPGGKSDKVKTVKNHSVFDVLGGLGLPRGCQDRPKIDFSGSVAPFSNTLDFCSSKVGHKSAFLEKDRGRAERFLRPGAHEGDLS